MTIVAVGELGAQTSPPPDTKASDARSRLVAMQTYLRSSEALSFRTAISQAGGDGARQMSADYIVRQPNLFRVAVKMPTSYVFISDGKTFVIQKPSTRSYAQYRADKTMLGTMYSAAGLMNISGRMLDFFWTADHGKSSNEVQVATLPAIKSGTQQCDGIRVSRYEETNEVWVQSSGPPLPCKLISRRTDGSSSIAQTYLFKWIATPSIDDKTFSVEPAPGSRKVDAFDLR